MKIFVIGDSISVHYGLYLEKYLKNIAEYARKEGTEKALKNLDIPLGSNGGDSANVLEYMKARADKNPVDADYILINCGLHDIKTDKQTGEKQIPVKEYEKNLREIIKVSRSMKLKMAWMSTTPADEDVHNRIQPDFLRFKKDCIEYNDAANKIMKKNKVPIIDLYTFTNNLGDDIYCDHVHFHEHIREKQAAFIAGWINNCSLAVVND